MKDQKKKIVFKVPEFPHLTETFIVAQIVTAIKLGYEIEILVRKRIEESTNLRSNLIEEYSLLKKVIIEDYKIPKNRILRYIKWILLLVINVAHFNNILSYHKEQSKFSLTCLFQWVFYNRFREADLFHVQYGTNSNPLATLKKTGFKPSLIVTFHGHDAFFPISGYIHNNGYYDNLFKYGNLITANTPYLAEKIINLGCPKEKLKIIPVGVDTGFFYSNNDKKKYSGTLKLITVGRLHEMKGQVYCIEAVRILINKGIDVTLTIIGDGAERITLEKLIIEYQLESKVFLSGKKSQEEVRRALWESDVYLLTGQATMNGLRESQGLATLEAQACGLPVVVFDSGGIKYTLINEQTGFVCDEYDVEGVAEKIKLLYLNPVLRVEMGLNTVDFIKKHFSQNYIDTVWEKEYLQLLLE
jgi:colanic acid/amylovoran biosynthesis glycosyltransferase